MTRTRLLAHAWVQLGLWVALAIVANHLASAVPWRFDLTADQRYSLAPATIEAVARLDKPLTATVWFTEDLGPPHHNHRQALLDLLTELQAASPELDVVVRDPTGDPEQAAAARRAGIRPVTWASRDWEGAVARQVWMGVSLDHGERHEAVDALPSIERMEPDLVGAILSVTTEAQDRRTVGWLVGDGEPDPTAWPAEHPLGRLAVLLRARYELVLVDASSEPVPDSVDALLVIGPQLAVPARTREHLDAYLMRGRPIGLFLSSLQPDFQRRVIREVPHELDPLLAAWGVELLPGPVLDRQHNEEMRAPVGEGVAVVSYPLAPATTAFARAHLPVRDLTRAVVPFATAVRPLPTRAEAAIWLSTEATAVRSVGLTSLDALVLERPRPDEEPGPFPVMVALQGSFPSAFPESGQEGAPTRLVVAGSADMVANNVELVLNSVDWLLEDPRLVSIRARTSGPPVLVPPASPTPLKLAMGGGPLALLALLAALAQARRRREG